jgi:hypothetical protein
VLIRAGLGALVAVAAATMTTVTPAHADSSVTVRGTSFPDAGVQLGIVGCGSVLDRTAEPVQPRIGRGPAIPPAGERSVGFDLAGGNALGAQLAAASVTRTAAASMAVYAPDGATGVAYAGYRSPADAGTDRVWFGRAPLTAAPGAWHNVDATLLSYVWTQYDMATGLVVRADEGAPPSNIYEFTAAHGGDGPGLFTIGFGCDGRPFHLDALRSGTAGDVTTYDVEGLLTAAEMDGTHATIEAGESIELQGALRLTGGTALPHATLVLEQLLPGTDVWWPVEVVPAADARVSVAPDRRTEYRWRFADRPLASGSESRPFVVDVVPAATTPSDGLEVPGSTG